MNGRVAQEEGEGCREEICGYKKVGDAKDGGDEHSEEPSVEGLPIPVWVCDRGVTMSAFGII